MFEKPLTHALVLIASLLKVYSIYTTTGPCNVVNIWVINLEQMQGNGPFSIFFLLLFFYYVCNKYFHMYILNKTVRNNYSYI